jgi:hypothetical protein
MVVLFFSRSITHKASAQSRHLESNHAPCLLSNSRRKNMAQVKLGKWQVATWGP